MPEVFILGCIYALPVYRDLMRAEDGLLWPEDGMIYLPQRPQFLICNKRSK